jgi:hypothetical protein
LVHSDFLGIPLPHHVSYTNTENLKQRKKDMLHHFPFEKTEECNSEKK